MLSMQKCRVCGKEYEACHSLRPASNVFRWQAVACSPECGEKFLADILASRAINSTDDIVEKENEKEIDADSVNGKATSSKDDPTKTYKRITKNK